MFPSNWIIGTNLALPRSAQLSSAPYSHSPSSLFHAMEWNWVKWREKSNYVDWGKKRGERERWHRQDSSWNEKDGWMAGWMNGRIEKRRSRLISNHLDVLNTLQIKQRGYWRREKKRWWWWWWRWWRISDILETINSAWKAATTKKMGGILRFHLICSRVLWEERSQANKTMRLRSAQH